MKDIYEYIDGLNCLIDLHIHLDGSLSIEMVKEIAAIQGIDIDCSDDELKNKLSVSKDCKDLNEYLLRFDYPLSLLQSKEAIAKAVELLVKEQESQGVVYSEIRFAPQLHLKKGLSQHEVVKAALEGLLTSEKYWHADSQHNLILCCMRGNDNEEANRETVKVASTFYGKLPGVVAVDLAGAEGLYPTKDFCGIFKEAQKLGIPFTIHAGEAAGAESIMTALDMGAIRIGHGVRAIEDNAVIDRLREQNIALEMCPTSNMNTKVIDELSNYPIVTYKDMGIPVTINTDNMSVSDTDIKSELRMIAETFSLDIIAVKELLLNGVEAALTDECEKNRLRARVELAMWRV